MCEQVGCEEGEGGTGNMIHRLRELHVVALRLVNHMETTTQYECIIFYLFRFLMNNLHVITKRDSLWCSLPSIYGSVVELWLGVW